MKRRVALLFAVAGLLMLAGLRILTLSPTPASFAGNSPLSSTATITNSTLSTRDQPDDTNEANVILGGSVWSDANMNGVRDAGEVGISHVVVDVYEAGAQGETIFVNSTRTDRSGAYLFASLESEKSYFVEAHRPNSHPNYTLANRQNGVSNDYIDSDANPTSGRTHTTYLAAGESNTSHSIGLVPTLACLPSIGFLTDPAGNPLANNSFPADAWSAWGIWFTASGEQPHIFNHGKSNNEGADFGGSGLYVPDQITIHFESERPLYGIRILDENGVAATGRVQAFDEAGQLINEAAILPYQDATSQLAILNAVAVRQVMVELIDGGSITELIFCESPDQTQTTVGGLVWRDADGNGRHAAGESGYAGVAVELRDGRRDNVLLAETVTDGTGRYQFEHLLEGTYQVVVQQPNETLSSYDLDGTADGVATALMVASGESLLGVDFGFRPNQPQSIDYGDAPPQYALASHQIHPQLRLGFSVDSDSGSQPSFSAETDDTDSNNDDDGIVFLGAIGGMQQVQITLFHNIVDQPAELAGWIDFNRDGDFEDADEQIVLARVSASAEQQLLIYEYSIPNTATGSTTVARFRISTAANLLSSGESLDGEVEDYQVRLPGDYGDAPYAYGNPSHLLANGLKLGVEVGADAGPMQSIAADQDDSDDGIRFIDGKHLQRGTMAEIEATTSNQAGVVTNVPARLMGWLDFNGDGQFDELSEQIVHEVINPDFASQTSRITYTVPESAVCGTTYARFRIADRSLNATEQGGPGEVEDYQVKIDCDATASIGDMVWHDVNMDGEQGVGEVGLPNVTLALHRDNGDGAFDAGRDVKIAATTSNANGRYLFSELARATYFVVIDDANWQLTDYNVVRTSEPVVIAADEGQYSARLGVKRVPTTGAAALVGGRVWIDNGDGICDSAEFGISNATIHAKNPAGQTIATTVSDALGHYRLELPATDEVKLTVAADSIPAEALPIRFDDEMLALGLGSAELNHDFGFRLPDTSSISGQIWIDNRNKRVDTGELLLPAVTVELVDDRNGNGRWDHNELIIGTTRSKSDGQFIFSGLPAGDYLVFVSDVANMLSQYDLQAGLSEGQLRHAYMTSYSITLAAGETMDTAHFNYMLAMPEAASGAIGDLVWYETDFNGVYDEGEAGIANVHLVLLDQNDQLLRETTTDASGHYLFTELAPGSYQVQISDTMGVLDEYMPTLLRTMRREAVDIELGNGEIVMGADFGYTIGQLSLGDRVWTDTNGDGWQNEEGNTGIASIPLFLYADQDHDRVLTTNDLLIDKTMTDAEGYYRFENLRPGSYFVIVPNAALQLPQLLGGATTAYSGENGITAREDMPLDSNGELQPKFGIVSGIIDLIGDEVAQTGRFNNTIDFGFLPSK